MNKDPAFLFYSRDFYEGTRMMLPEERACYVDLMIYQHQNGTIPNNPKRLLMYCSGVDEATLIATLEAKFERTENGWENKRLKKEISDRQNYKNDLSLSGKIGQFWKKAKNILSKKEYETLRKTIDKQWVTDFINQNKTIDEPILKGLLKRRLSNKADEDANVNKDVIKNEKGGVGEKAEITLPYKSQKFKDAWEDWKEYKSKEHRFKYKTTQSEQAALSQISNLARDELEAIEIIKLSIANGWKGLFALKSNTNEKRKPDPRFDDRKSKFEGASKRRGTVKFT